MTTTPTVANEELTFDPCRGNNHAECAVAFAIPFAGGGEYSATCNCSCHYNDKEKEEEVTTDHTLYEVDFVSVTDLAKMDELAQEAADLFSFDPNFFLAAIYVANEALTPDEHNSFPMWKAYEEAKEQIIQGSDDTITLCTGSIIDGFCKVCGGIPGVIFTDTDSELELHILQDLPEKTEEIPVYGQKELELDLDRIDAIKDGEFEAKLEANKEAFPSDDKVKTWTQRLENVEDQLGVI